MRCAAGAAAVVAIAGSVAIGVGASSAAETTVTCASQPATIVATADHQTLTGTDGGDVISANGFRNIDIHAGMSDPQHFDIVCGGPGDDVIETLGPAEVDGEGGDDRITVGGGEVFGGSGDDSLHVYNGGLIHGMDGNDHITVYANDPYNPAPANSFGAFKVYGGAGNDTTWMVSALYSTNQPKPPNLPLLDVFFAGGPGTDLFVLRGIAGPKGTLHADLAKRTTNHGPGGVATWGPGTNRVAGTAYRDYFTGSSHGDYVDARGGPDVVHGYGGNDVLLGGSGRDFVDGGKGRDVCGGEHKVRCERRP